MGQPSGPAGTAAAAARFRRLQAAGGVRHHTWDGGAAAGLFKGVLMESACSIHIGSDNIYPLWNG